MNINEVVNTVKNFEEEYKKGYYAYELSAHNVSFKRQSDPDPIYVYFLYDYNREYSNTCRVEKVKEFSDGYVVVQRDGIYGYLNKDGK